ncbi:conserved hypothetical protein [Histoplasma capsulatum var. duboisii H88]|uniref:Putative phospholipase n=1 Tax=Ajellomyces capsulatus (strain H88) TaxID=544711 RepID=F0UJQ1_AJEC8|nr:conserved hypothetical protein [Histoplasma capsulatum var. duboisii H88]QSS56437.1 hypothetical protein I7I53_04643 [Histoplasma capsulatum var. duboisii H88]
MALSLLQVPSFPSYTGPHQVGTAEFEIPVSSLESPAPTPKSDIPLPTILFRIFYPADDVEPTSRPMYWIPDPQATFIGGLAELLGVPKRLSNILGLLPSTVKWTKIPAFRDAPLKASTLPSKRWPVMVFSHGIAGSRYMYSYILGCLASYGIVIFAPEHRDGSSPSSLLRNAHGQVTEKVPYQRMKHVFDPNILQRRHAQLRIRFWELGLVHDALLKMDAGTEIPNFVQMKGAKGPVFSSSLDIHSPGSIAWAGHSFGAASVVQFVKSIYWGYQICKDPSSISAEPSFSQYRPLYEPRSDSEIVSQVIPASPLILLDLWNLPLLGDDVKWLWEKPLPCYAETTEGQPRSPSVLAILSDEFFKWKAGLKATRHVLSYHPAPGSDDQGTAEVGKQQPKIFYTVNSAHLSQSDIGLVFPWMMKRWGKAEEPERTMQLNVTAIIQMLRECGVPFDLDEDVKCALENVADPTLDHCDNDSQNGNGGKQSGFHPIIFSADGSVRGWLPVSLADDTPSVPEFEVRSPPKL